MKKIRKERLRFREWIICLFIFFSIGSLFFISSPLNRKPLKKVAGDVECQEKMKVYISGAVLKSGEYEVRVGSSLKSVLDRAGFESFADRKALYLKKTLLNSCEIFVPEKSINKRENRFNLSK